MDNKYNLEVGDVVEDLTTFNIMHTITSIEEEGIFFDNNSMADGWQYVNRSLDRGDFTLIKAKKAFPEKWVFKAENINEAIQFSDWVNSRINKDPNLNNSTYTPSEIINHYFHYPKYMLHNSSIHTASDIAKEYSEITFEQFKENYLGKTKMKKEIVGYNLKKGFEKYIDAVDAILKSHYPDISIKDIFAANFKKNNYAFGSSFDNEKSYQKFLTEASVLDLWFEPVYKQSQRKISIGSPSKEITITNKEEIIFENTKLKIGFAESLMNMFEGSTASIYNYYPTKIWIGCNDGTEVTKEEVENIIAIYNELNS